MDMKICGVSCVVFTGTGTGKGVFVTETGCTIGKQNFLFVMFFFSCQSSARLTLAHPLIN